MAALHVSQTEAAKRARTLVLLVFLTLVATIIWASMAKVQEAVVGIGNVVPAQAVQRIENLDGGILKEVQVKEGQLVKKGQTLLLLEAIRFSAALGESVQEQLSLASRKSRLEAELKSISFDGDNVVITPQLLTDNQFNVMVQQQIFFTYQSKISQLNAQLAQNFEELEQQQQAINEQSENIKSLTRRLKLLNREVELTADVVASGAVAEMELLKLQREQITIEGEISRANASKLQLLSAKQQVVERRKAIAYEFLAKAQNELDEVNNNEAKIKQSQKALADRLNKTQIVSPLAGTVKNIITRSVGEVIESGQAMMEIVPLDDQLLIETRIAPQDIGFLHKGMKALVKFTAYDFVIYGGLKGEVVYVGADAQQLEDGTTYYEAHIKTTQNTLAGFPIIPGMQASVDILTGYKTVLDYWLKPLLRAKANAMKER